MQVYLFPGQGSQAKGMGGQLFDEFPEMVAQADAMLGYSIKKLCLEDPDQQLRHTQFTQPALFVVNALSYCKKLQETPLKPDYVCGHSLGEYNALFAANVVNFETGLKLVKKRGELMSQAQGGGMAAVVGLKLADVTHILMEKNLTNIAIANDNSYQQLVISGLQHDIELAQSAFSALKGVSFIPLKVSGAFHSPFMQTAQQQFADYLSTFEFSIPTIPVIANVDAEPYHPAITKSHLANQMTHSVQWTKMMEYLLRQDAEMAFSEIGTGTVLSGLIRRIKNKQ